MKINLLKNWKKPFRIEVQWTHGIKLSVIFGAFVFGFLYFFKPFGLEQIGKKLLPVSLGFGLVTTISMVLLFIFTRVFNRSFFHPQKWTVGKEIVWNLVHLLVIGIGNGAFYSYISGYEFSLNAILWFQFMTIAIGIFPLSFRVFTSEASLRRKYEKEASDLHSSFLSKTKDLPKNNLIIPSNTKGDADIHTHLNDLYYLKSSGNYVEVFYKEPHLKKALIRNSLKSLEETFKDTPFLFRCHKGFMVNLSKVNHVSGNSLGLVLHLKDLDEEIPVSRSLTQIIKEKLA